MPKVKKIFKTIHSRSDSRGNALIVDQEPVYGVMKIKLHLKGERDPRLIGQIDPNNRIVLMKRDKLKHFFFQMSSYGFNYTVIKEMAVFDHVLLQEMIGDHVNYYMIPRQFILDSGVVKEFKKTGFEIQIMLRVEYLEKFKTTRRFEPSKLLEA